MTGRTRRYGLAGVVISGSLLFGVGFAGAQAPVQHTAPKAEPVVSLSTGSPNGGGGCGDLGDITSVNPSDL